jgi:hypothetical protein
MGVNLFQAETQIFQDSLANIKKLL